MIGKTWLIKEHWRRLLAEFFIIVVGVLAAMAVNNWNDARKDRQTEAEYLAGIAADLAATEASLQRTMEAAKKNQAALRQVIAVAKGADPPPPADLTWDLIRSTYLGLPQVSRITFDEIVSTGSLRLIRDHALKRRLAEFYEQFDFSSQFYPEYRRKEAATELVLRGLLPLEARLDNRRIPDIPNVIDVDAVTAELRSRKDLVPILEDMVWTQMRAILGAETQLKLIDELQAMLPAEDLGSE